MAMNIRQKQDVSYLFSGLNSNQNTSAGLLGGNWLSDYASIKNGSYGKLMKAYFNMDASDEVSKLAKGKDSLTATEEAKANAKVQSASDALKESADALLETGKESVFALKDITTKDENGVESTGQGYDVNAIYKAVSAFADDYNAVLQAAEDTGSTTIENRAAAMVNDSISYMKSLKSVGITLGEDGTLSVDKKTFLAADMGAVKNLFNGVGSYAYNISTEASMMNYAAQRAAGAGSAYTATGQYGTDFSSGNLFDSWF